MKRLVLSVNPVVILVQETMTSSLDACETFLKLFPAWNICGLNADGTFGGLLVAWNSSKASFKPYVTIVGILLEGIFLGLQRPIKILNIYGPYNLREVFWDNVVCSGLLSDPHLILAGDLNFTLSPNEVWGLGHLSDPLSGYFQKIFVDALLVHIVPSVLVPTWFNGRHGKAGLAKRLDRFFMAEGLCQDCFRFRSWSCASGILDHKQVFL